MTIGYIIAYIISTLAGILVTFTCRFGFNPHPVVADTPMKWLFLCSIGAVVMIAVGVHGLASLIKTRKH